MSVYIVVGTLHFNLEDTPTIVLSDRKLGQFSGAQHDKAAAGMQSWSSLEPSMNPSKHYDQHTSSTEKIGGRIILAIQM